MIGQLDEATDDSEDIKVGSAKRRISTILASAPGIAAQALAATLDALPSVNVIGTAAGCLSALRMARENQADLVVIDSNLPMEDVRALIRRLPEEGLPTRSLILGATRSQVRGALAAGADFALRRQDVNNTQWKVILSMCHRPRHESGHESMEAAYGKTSRER